MGYIEKRQRKTKDGKPGPIHWRARYRDANGRERSETFSRQIDAQRFLERNGADIQRGDWVDPKLRRAIFDEWAETWWATTIKLRPNTRRGYWLLLQNHVRPAFDGYKVTSIDFIDVERWISEKIAAGHSSKHVREMLTVLSQIMKLAVKGGVRKDNPAIGHSLPIQRRRLRRADMLSMDELLLLMEHIPEHYRSAMWLLVFTGIRPAELCGLRVRDVDLIRGTVTVSQTLSPIPAFDGRAREHLVGSTKTTAGQRTIPLPRWLCDRLAADLAAREAPIGPEAPLFLNAYGRPLQRDTFRARIVRPALEAAGLPTSFRTYDVRHAHASMLIDDGANILAIAERMGHSDPAVTLKVYGHLFDGVQEQLTERLEQRRQASKPKAPAEIVPLREAEAG